MSGNYYISVVPGAYEHREAAPGGTHMYYTDIHNNIILLLHTLT